MTLTFISESLTGINTFDFFKKLRPNRSNLTHTTLNHLIRFIAPTTPKPVAAPQTTRQPINTLSTTSERHIRLFIRLMEKALIGSLISLWLLAIWVVGNSVYTLIF